MAEPAKFKPIKIIIGPVTIGGKYLITFFVPINLKSSARTIYSNPATTIPPKAYANLSSGVISRYFPLSRWATVSKPPRYAKALSGTDTVIAVTGLPFSPVRCLLDPDCEISDAATRCEMHLTETGAQTNNAAHFRVNVTELTDPIDIYVDHHWGKPYGLDTVAGVLRTPGRYWTVSGNFDYSNRISGQFHYCRTNHLDQGFYESAGTLDSIVLMHRYNSHHPWGCVSHSHNSSANGYFSCLLEQGEYALAVVDRALVGIEEPSSKSDISLFPNPLRKGEALTINTPVEGSFTVTIHDTAGRRVWRKKGCRNGQSLHPTLKAGTYLVTIENNCVSLQAKLVQL